MAEQLLTLRFELQVEYALSALGTEERRTVEGWFEHLRRWPADEFIRSRSRKLKPDEELYAFQTSSSNLIFAFSIEGDTATVLSIFTKEALAQVQAASAAP